MVGFWGSYDVGTNKGDTSTYDVGTNDTGTYDGVIDANGVSIDSNDVSTNNCYFDWLIIIGNLIEKYV